MAADSAAAATALAAVSVVRVAAATVLAAAIALAAEAVAVEAVNSVLDDSDRIVVAAAATAFEECAYVKLELFEFFGKPANRSGNATRNLNFPNKKSNEIMYPQPTCPV